MPRQAPLEAWMVFQEALAGTAQASGCWGGASGITEVLRHLEITESTSYRWLRAYAGDEREARSWVIVRRARRLYAAYMTGGCVRG